MEEERFEQQRFKVSEDGEELVLENEGGEKKVEVSEVGEPPIIVDKKEFVDQKESPILHFREGTRAKTSRYTGKEWVMLQDDIIARAVEDGKKDKQGFAPFRFLANANPERQGKEWVDISKGDYNHRINRSTNNIIKLISREGSVRRAEKYLKNHRIGLSNEEEK